MVVASVVKLENSADGKVMVTLEDTTGTTMEVSEDRVIAMVNMSKLEFSNAKVKNGHIVMNSADEEDTNTRMSEHDNDMVRMHELVGIIKKADAAYYSGAEEIMSNYEYDKLTDELRVLEEKTGVILPESNTRRVGYEVVSELPKERHSEPMLSLAKTKSISELQRFLGNHTGVLSWKMDGITVVMHYNNGILQKAITRGNGEVGEVITFNAKQFKDVPLVIPFDGELILRGEAYITYSDFEHINSGILNPDEKFKNPRNLCSGTVRQLDSSVTAKRNVRWRAFTLVKAEGRDFKTFDSQMDWLETLGFKTVGRADVTEKTLPGVIETFSEEVSHGDIDIPCDGLVLTFNDIAYGKSLGRTEKSPRHSCAFKWTDELAETTLLDIEWSASRSGLINPVAIFEPVELGGSTIQRASVHNVSILGDLALGYGDKITVYKANMIIPQINDNLTRSATCKCPDCCPVCGAETELYEEESSGVLTLWCPNPECPAKGSKLIEHFVSRDAMNIVGIAESTIKRLLEADIISTPSSLFDLWQYSEEIINMPGFGEESFANMVNAIDNAYDVKLSNLVYALGIPNVGLSTSKLICKYFEYDLRSVINATYTQLIEIPGVGETIASSFSEYFLDSDNREEFKRIYSHINILPEGVEEGSISGVSMEGLVFCVTGAVNIFKSRREVKDMIEALGGKLTGSVSKSTDYLVTNDTTSGSKKNVDAQKYGIPILTEQQFIDKFQLEVG